MEVTISSRDLRQLGRDLRAAGRSDLRKEAMKRMRDEVKPIVPEIKAAIRRIPSGGDEGRSTRARAARPRKLRDATARGVQIKASLSGAQVGIRIRVDTRHFPDDERNLSKYLEGTIPRWRSPNWGRDEWKTQRSHPYFFPTIQPHIPRVQAAIAKVVQDIADEITKGGNE